MRKYILLFLLFSIFSEKSSGQSTVWKYKVDHLPSVTPASVWQASDSSLYFNLNSLEKEVVGLKPLRPFLLKLNQDGKLLERIFFKLKQPGKSLIPYQDSLILSTGLLPKIYTKDGQYVKDYIKPSGQYNSYKYTPEGGVIFSLGRNRKVLFGDIEINYINSNDSNRTEIINTKPLQLKFEHPDSIQPSDTSNWQLYTAAKHSIPLGDKSWIISVHYGPRIYTKRGYNSRPKNGSLLSLKRDSIIWEYPKEPDDFTFLSVANNSRSIGILAQKKNGETYTRKFSLIDFQGNEIKSFPIDSVLGSARIELFENYFIMTLKNVLYKYTFDGELVNQYAIEGIDVIENVLRVSDNHIVVIGYTNYKTTDENDYETTILKINLVNGR